jgi:CDP-diacylglycerol--serine O-phosphatidyltransferase
MTKTHLMAVLSVFCSIERRFILAFVLIFAGYEFDCFDGKVARWRNECSELGKELDSFSDLVCSTTSLSL